MGDKIRIVTDRSRTDAYQRCHRYRYLAYHWNGTGMRPKYFNPDITIGLSVHEGVGALLEGKGVGEAVKIALDRFDKEVKSSEFDLRDTAADPTAELAGSTPDNLILPAFSDTNGAATDYINYFVAECRSLIEIILRGWAISDQGLSKLLSEYDVVEVEKEETFTLYEDEELEVIFMSRPDAILRRKLDGGIMAFSLKTTKTWDNRKEMTGESDMQGMSEVVAIERRLGVRCEGVQMLYLLTGETRKNDSGFKERNNGILRPWVKAGVMGDEEFAFSAMIKDQYGKSKRLTKDWQRRNCWELGVTLEEYVAGINAYDPQLGQNPLNTLIVQPDIYWRDKDKLERWEREAAAQEARIAQGLVTLARQDEEANMFAKSNKQEVMDSIFPHYSSSCTYPTPCSYREVCWGSPYLLSDPEGSGLVPREPHHDLEREMLVNITKKG